MNPKRTLEPTGTEWSAGLASYADLHRHVARGRQLHAEATAETLAAAFRAAARPLRAPPAWLAPAAGGGGRATTP